MAAVKQKVVEVDTTMDTVNALRKLLGSVTDKERDKAWTSIDTDIERFGKKIVLPSDPTDMSYDAAIAALTRKKAEDAQVFDVNEIVHGLPWDSAVAIYKAMQELYGIVTASTKMTWFGPRNPQYLTVKTGIRKTDVIQVPIGQLELPNTVAKFELGIHHDFAYIVGKVNKADRARLVEIASRAREILAEESIYKGKAIKINVDEKTGQLSVADQPEFLDVERVLKTDMIHPALVAELINVNIFSPLENTEKCRLNKIPLKRGILMEGPYGTGKSLTARVTAKVAVDNGWGFIMLNRASGLDAALRYSKTIQPMVIFTEDIDRNADRENEEVNQLINTLDGVDTKTNEIMVVVTTNHVDKIDRALLRPGRFDAIISLERPDAATAESLVRKYAGILLSHKENLAEAGKMLAGQVPASIREVVERAKLAMLQRGTETIDAQDLTVQAFGMKKHLELLADKVGVETPQDKLWSAFGEIIKTHTNPEVEVHTTPLDEKIVKLAKAMGANI